MQTRVIGYARISTNEQHLDLQIQALEKAGCDVIFRDEGVSGKNHSRPGLDKALKQLRSNDKLVVWRLDRLGRSLSHLIMILDKLGAQDILFKSLCEYIDTSSSGGRLMFHIMASLAEFERGLISERTRAGMAAAKANGKQLGRKPALTPEQCQTANDMIIKGEKPTNVALTFGVSPRTLVRAMKKYM